jgi:hypothetical protein
VTADQRSEAGAKAIPPITDAQNGFAWPDSEFGVFRTDQGYTFFASDGGQIALSQFIELKLLPTAC